MRTKSHSKFFTNLTVFLVLGLMVNPIFANDLLNGQNWLNPSFIMATSTPVFDLPMNNDGSATNNNGNGGSAFVPTNDATFTTISKGVTTDDVTNGLAVESFTPAEEISGKDSEESNHSASSTTTESSDFSIISLEATKPSFVQATSTSAFVVPIINNTSDTPSVFVNVNGTSLSPVDAASSLVAGSNLVMTDINDDGAPDVLGDCDEIDCIAYVNDGTGRLIEDGVVSVSNVDPVDTVTVLVAEAVDSDGSGNVESEDPTFVLEETHLADMDGDGHLDLVSPTGVRYNRGDGTFTEKYDLEILPEEEFDPFELGDGEAKL